MKKLLSKRTAAVLLSLAMALSLAACSTPASDPSTSSGDSEQPYVLQMEISQDDWNDNRQYVELSTGITMSYVEMGVEDGPALILQHGMTDNSRPTCAATATATNPTRECTPFRTLPPT